MLLAGSIVNLHKTPPQSSSLHCTSNWVHVCNPLGHLNVLLKFSLTLQVLWELELVIVWEIFQGSRKLRPHPDFVCLSRVPYRDNKARRVHCFRTTDSLRFDGALSFGNKLNLCRDLNAPKRKRFPE